MKIAVLGAGAWGTALAVNAAAGHAVTLWARDLAQAQELATDRVNNRYLPEIELPAGLQLAGGQAAFDGVLQSQDLLVIATPMSGLRGMLHAVKNVQTPVAWLCKGFETPQKVDFEASFGLLAHEIRAQAAPDLIAGVLSGPSFAQEVARGQPTALNTSVEARA
jgi:glycerol-3-phosphate dehydrogenase (NAD(P)+)